MKKIPETLKKLIGVNDILVLLGMGIMTTGIWMFEPKIALIVLGSILFVLGLYLSIPRGK